MKWLFATLVALNLIVFAGMIASKMLKQHMPVAAAPQVQSPPTIIINGADLVPKQAAASQAAASAPAAAATTAATPAASGSNNNKARANTQNSRNEPRAQQNHQRQQNNEPRRAVTNADAAHSDNSGTPRAKYRECSARVSMPEDDYHRIKGLLARYPHAASRQVVDNGNGASTARMNVVFMQVSDQQASAIQGVVGRYGQLNRSACNR